MSSDGRRCFKFYACWVRGSSCINNILDGLGNNSNTSLNAGDSKIACNISSYNDCLVLQDYN